MTMIAILAAMSACLALSPVEGLGDELPLELPQSPDRPSINSSELKGLREHNIFSPYRTKPFEPKRGETRRPDPVPVAPSKPKPLQVTGLFADPVTGVPKAIVEDRNDERHRHLKEPKFCTGGEEFLGLKIEAVTADHVVVVRGDVRKECKVGDALPEGDVPAVAPSAAPSTSESGAKSESTPTPAPALEEGPKNDILEALRAKNKRKRDEP